jgi:hypothetical protein
MGGEYSTHQECKKLINTLVRKPNWSPRCKREDNIKSDVRHMLVPA